ncbi:MAG: hypothetical protein ABIU96_11770 [Rhodanobacter sp.]
MNKFKLLVFAALAVGASLAGEAYAAPVNFGPPPGYILSLSGQPLPSGYAQYTTSFVATDASTNVTFALRDDPAFISLDNISVTTGGGANLIQNAGFEGGNTASGGNAQAPTDWTYLNQWGATFGGVVQCANTGQGGSNCNWYNGAVQAYDAISQAINTTIGATYNISFWAFDNSGSRANWSALSTNGDVTDIGGNGINLTVYAGAIPPPINAPEPAELGMFAFGVLLIGLVAERRRRLG